MAIDNSIKKEYVLGIDTSNYTTSVAVTDRDENVICDNRKMLLVKPGERGLRQQEALFQHVDNLPGLLEMTLTEEVRRGMAAVAFSVRPRPVEGSYMPCFKAGETVARTIAASLGVPVYEFSHQEGHIAAVAGRDDEEFLCYHLSGGTCELLKVTKAEAEDIGNPFYNVELIGGSRDISIGQLLDRTGVALGMNFPAGRELDELALLNDQSDEVKNHQMAGKTERLATDRLTGVKIEDLWFSLSGLETQVLRELNADSKALSNASELSGINNDKLNEISVSSKDLISELFKRIATLLIKETKMAVSKTGINKVIFAGGVSKSRYIRTALSEEFLCNRNNGINITFGEYSEDNAVGIALLGGRKLWL